MKFITSTLVLIALFGAQEEVSAIKIRSTFTDDLAKSLAEDMAKDAEEEVVEPKKNATVVAKVAVVQTAPATNATAAAALAKKPVVAVAAQKPPAKKEVKTEEEEIPMDNAAIKAYSSVIADAAEDSEPATPVQYTEVLSEDEAKPRHEVLGMDPMGSMI